MSGKTIGSSPFLTGEEVQNPEAFGPTFWNGLLLEVCLSPILSTFWNMLKTGHLQKVFGARRMFWGEGVRGEIVFIRCSCLLTIIFVSCQDIFVTVAEYTFDK